MIYRILFHSRASFRMKEEEVFKILSKSKVNNKKAGLTGILLYVNGHFMEFLEGEERVVKAMFKKINQDPRHDDSKIVLQGVSPNRLFDGWNLAYKAHTVQDLKDIQEANQPDYFDLTQELVKDSDIAFSFLRQFYNKGALDFFNFWRKERIEVEFPEV